MTNLLLAITSTNDIFVLECGDSEGRDIISEYGRQFDKYPYDLGLYALRPGIYLWTGTLPEIEDVEWVGSAVQLMAFKDELWSS